MHPQQPLADAQPRQVCFVYRDAVAVRFLLSTSTHFDFIFFCWARRFVLNPPQGLGIMSNGVLPNHSSAVQEKLHRANGSASWTRPVLLPIPGVRTRRLRLYVPNVTSFSQIRGSRVRRSRGPLLLCMACMALILTVIILRSQSSRQWTENWPPPLGEASTLVFRREDLQRIWKWEIASGHFPSRMTSTWLFSIGQYHLCEVLHSTKTDWFENTAHKSSHPIPITDCKASTISLSN